MAVPLGVSNCSADSDNGQVWSVHRQGCVTAESTPENTLAKNHNTKLGTRA